MLLRMSRRPTIGRHRFDSIEWLQHGASPLPEWLARFWIDLLGPERVVHFAGQVERTMRTGLEFGCLLGTLSAESAAA